MRFVSKKKVGAALVALLVLGGAAAAFAYWTGGGAGTGTAGTTTPSAVIVNQTAATGLYPGATVNLSGTFNNPNGHSVYIANVTASIDTFSIRPDVSKPACTQADFSIGGTATVGVQVAAGNGVGAWTGLTVSMTNAGTNQDNCKTISVPITYAANAS